MTSSTDLDTFRGEARQWLQENFPASLKDNRTQGIAGIGTKFTGDAKL